MYTFESALRWVGWDARGREAGASALVVGMGVLRLGFSLFFRSFRFVHPFAYLYAVFHLSLSFFPLFLSR